MSPAIFDNAVLRLPRDESDGRRTLTLSPPCVAQPFALLLWRTAPGSRVHQLTVNMKSVFDGVVHALLFEAEVSWDYFGRCLTRRPDGLETINTRDVGRFFRFHTSAMVASDRIALDVEGRFEHGVVLVRTPALALPENEPGGFAGIVPA